ncbi:hypothetical protein TD95_001952 [Thielaviopsis punctulata]|uniref:glutaminase n=1 Tax=Thielaviopsis punctulata TaxID=72032 RepID=A0A0F4ZGW9_9PEZI|nr:hypothetical protein TD95_001952 [Thielaviopsis punctulata]
MSTPVTVGVLALQGGFHEHLNLLSRAAAILSSQPAATLPSQAAALSSQTPTALSASFDFIQVRTPADLLRCSALVIPGGESTTIANLARQSGLMQPLRDFVQTQKKPVWGTCAGLILLADEARGTKIGGQELIGGLAVRVQRNHFGRQVASFTTLLALPFLAAESEAGAEAHPPEFQAVFIRAPIVEAVLPAKGQPVEVLARLPGDDMGDGRNSRAAEGGGREMGGRKIQGDKGGRIVAVRQGNIVGMSFHPELTSDARIHAWWLREVVKSCGR